MTSPYLRQQDPLGPVFEEFLEADQRLVEKTAVEAEKRCVVLTGKPQENGGLMGFNVI